MDINKNVNAYRSDSGDLVLPDDIANQFIDFVKNRFGIVIKSGHRELLTTVGRECQARAISPDEYLSLLQNSEVYSDISSKFVGTITIGETYFFRDKQQVSVLENIVLPEMIHRKAASGLKSLRIWSAGCSSGEEIYTIIMLAKKLIKDFREWKYYFLATDINITSMKKGSDGKYSEWSMRSIPDEYLSRYFVKKDNHYMLDNEIRSMVSFEYLNLNTDAYPSLLSGTVSHDLIVCRNVMIYFDHPHIRSIMNRFSRCLADDGRILLGASDPVMLSGTGLSVAGKCPSLFSLGKQEHLKISENVAHLENIIKDETQKKDQFNEVDDVYKNNEGKERAIGAKLKINMDQIQEFYASSQWRELIDILMTLELNQMMNDRLMSIKAMALASVGELVQAMKVCDECIRINKMNKEAYFIKALVLSEQKEWKESESNFRKALFIDPNYLVCRHQLGLLLLRVGKISEGVKALTNVINSAKARAPEEIVPGTQNMCYGDLITALTNEVSLHQ